MYQTALTDERTNGTEMDSIKLIIISLNTITKKDLKAFQQNKNIFVFMTGGTGEMLLIPLYRLSISQKELLAS